MVDRQAAYIVTSHGKETSGAYQHDFRVHFTLYSGAMCDVVRVDGFYSATTHVLGVILG